MFIHVCMCVPRAYMCCTDTGMHTDTRTRAHTTNTRMLRARAPFAAERMASRCAILALAFSDLAPMPYSILLLPASWYLLGDGGREFELYSFSLHCLWDALKIIMSMRSLNKNTFVEQLFFYKFYSIYLFISLACSLLVSWCFNSTSRIFNEI